MRVANTLHAKQKRCNNMSIGCDNQDSFVQIVSAFLAFF